MDKFAKYECEGQMDIFEYQERMAGQIVTFDTRAEAHEKVDKATRYRQILETLDFYGVPLTAKEIAVDMRNKGYIPTDERNFTAPRLTELSKMGIVEPCGKKMCRYTGKNVTVYRRFKQ